MTFDSSGSRRLVLIGLAATVTALSCSPDVALVEEAAEVTDGEFAISSTCGAANYGGVYNCMVSNANPCIGDGNALRATHEGGNCDWTTATTGTWELKDSQGNVITTGHQTTTMHLNQGARMDIGGVPHFFAKSAYVSNGLAMAGWIPRTAITPAPNIGEQTPNLPTDQSVYLTDFQITSNNMEKYNAPTSGKYMVTDNCNEADEADDYLAKCAPDATGQSRCYVGLNMALPGYGAIKKDLFRTGAIFKRFTAVAQVNVQLYQPNNCTGGKRARSNLTMPFKFGYVVVGNVKRYGWIAADALSP
jgi:hypothetical protein